MDSTLLIGWQQEKVKLQQEVSSLQEELAESEAKKEQLESRSKALQERLLQSVSAPLVLSAQLEAEQHQWKRRLREAREREARQALLLHRLHNKVWDYRQRCQRLELQLQTEHTQLLHTERRMRDSHNDSLESTLIRLEEEEQRSSILTDTNSLLKQQLSQSEQCNQCLREDLQKLSSDWLRAVEEAGQKEMDHQKQEECWSSQVGQHQSALLSLWRTVMCLKQQCDNVKTVVDRDLWEWRVEFSRVSSSLLSSCHSVSSSLRLLDVTHNNSHSTAVYSTSTHSPATHRTASFCEAPPLGLADLVTPTTSPSSPSTFSPPPMSSTTVLYIADSSLAPPLGASSSSSSSNVEVLVCEEVEHQQQKEQENCREKQQEQCEVKSHNSTVSQLNQRLADMSFYHKAEVQQLQDKQADAERRLQSVTQAVVRLYRVLSSESSRETDRLSLSPADHQDVTSILSVLSHVESALEWQQKKLQVS